MSSAPGVSDIEKSPLVASDSIVFSDVGGVSSATLNLRNEHPTSSLYFKVRLTMPKSYRIRPNEGEIKVGESFPIPVTVTSRAPPVDLRAKDRFQIISIVADNKDQAADMWKQYTEEKKSSGKTSLPFTVYEQRLKCVFTGARDASTQPAASIDRPPTTWNTESSHRNETPTARKVASAPEDSPRAPAEKQSGSSSRPKLSHELQKTIPTAAAAPAKATNKDDMLKLVIIFVLGLILGKLFL